MSLPFLSTPPSCPCHVLGMSASFSMCIRSYISRRVDFSLSFVSLSFPLRSPCFHFCPCHVPFNSPLFPFHFPLLSGHVDFLCPLLISLHFLAFPFAPQYFPARNGFPAFLPKHTEFFQMFSKRRQETQTSKESAGGFEPGTPAPAPRRLTSSNGRRGGPPV